jgi:hypothetical protein
MTTAPSTTTVPPTTTLLPPLSSPQPGSLLQFVSPRIGWLVSGSAILGTTDGGKRWRTSFLDEASRSGDSLVGQVQGIDFANGSDGWALVDGRGLMGTRNGGDTWSAPVEPPQGPIVMFAFVGAEDGWVLTDHGALLQTVDGGESWLAEATPVPAVTLCATSARLWFGTGSGDVYTSVGGAPWRLSLPGAAVAPPFSNSVGPNPRPPPPWLACTGASAWALYQYGEAAGSDPLTVERTLNGGVDWGEPTSPKGVPRIATPTGISVSVQAVPGTPPTAWILGYCGPCGSGTASPTTTGTASVTTLTGGSVFSSAALPGAAGTSVSPVGVSFLDAALGWAVIEEFRPSDSGAGTTPTDVLLRSDDGGATWILVDPDIDA